MTTRIPRQERGQETKNKIMDAGLGLFSEKGYYHINSKDIAKKAEVSIGSFYAYFKDKKVLFLELLKEFYSAKFQAVYGDDCKDEEVTLNQPGIDGIVQNFTNNLLAAGDRYPVAFHLEILNLSFREEEIRTEYQQYCEQEISYLIAAFSNMQVTPGGEILKRIALVTLRLMDAYILVILREHNREIRDYLKASFTEALNANIKQQLPLG